VGRGVSREKIEEQKRGGNLKGGDSILEKKGERTVRGENKKEKRSGKIGKEYLTKAKQRKRRSPYSEEIVNLLKNESYGI